MLLTDTLNAFRRLDHVSSLPNAKRCRRVDGARHRARTATFAAAEPTAPPMLSSINAAKASVATRPQSDESVRATKASERRGLRVTKRLSDEASERRKRIEFISSFRNDAVPMAVARVASVEGVVRDVTRCRNRSGDGQAKFTLAQKEASTWGPSSCQNVR